MKLINRLDKRIKIYKQSEETNDLNETIGDPVLVTEVWAAIEPLRGKEYFAAFTEQVDVSTRIRIRYRTDIDRTMWLDYNGLIFDIESIIHTTFGRYELQLMCKERQ